MEKDFQKALAGGVSWLNPPAHYYKIPDMPMHALRQAGIRMGTAQKPYDCYILQAGWFFALELKQLRSTCLGKNDLREHQEEYLRLVDLAGGVGLVVVNFQVKLSAAQQKKRGCQTLNVAYGAPMAEIARAREELCRDSIPLEWWESAPCSWPLAKVGPHWDPTGLLEGAKRWRLQQ